MNLYVVNVGTKGLTNIDNAPKVDAIIVMGALVHENGQPSLMLADRLTIGLQLYQKGKAPKIIVSGDHGTKQYDEVNSMRQFLQDRGVKRADIFMDHAGFDTYDTLYRARDVFCVKKAVIVTQKFHLIRALYIANKLGLEVSGVSSDLAIYPGGTYYNAREVGARVKAFIQAGILHSTPVYLGKKIPVSGSGTLTDDGM
jgi:vancomycin permeability regulator SanA